MAAEKIHYATGRRKTSAARVFLSPGSGVITINGKKPEEYLHMASTRAIMLQPIMVTALNGKLDIKVTVKGGGEAGQAGAIRHGIARAIVSLDEANRPVLKKAGYLTRDSRMVERKKYGLRKARKATQFSKR